MCVCVIGECKGEKKNEGRGAVSTGQDHMG